MKAVKIFYIIMLLILTGCEGPSFTTNEENPSEPVKFSTSGNMVLGNILVAELGKTIYKKNDEQKLSSAKTRKDIMVNPVEAETQTTSNKEIQNLNNTLQELLNLNNK